MQQGSSGCVGFGGVLRGGFFRGFLAARCKRGSGLGVLCSRVCLRSRASGFGGLVPAASTAEGLHLA